MKKCIFYGTAILLILTLAGVFSFSRDEKPKACAASDRLIKSEAETAISLLQAVFDRQQKGDMTLEAAKTLGAGLLRELRYGTDGYFWADTTDGVNVVLYGRTDAEGRNRLEEKDSAGVFYVKAFLETGKAGGGYVDYLFTKLGQSEALPKRSYVKLFEPFGWVIGTGYYIGETGQ
ncbi:MAG: cache domain-containing protein [Candidatus Aminicenantales bacterium]